MRAQREAKKRCAMMSARETKWDFALPDAAVLPITSPKKLVPHDFASERLCVCVHGRERAGSAEWRRFAGGVE